MDKFVLTKKRKLNMQSKNFANLVQQSIVVFLCLSCVCDGSAILFNDHSVV